MVVVLDEGNASSSPSICGPRSWPLIMGALGGRDASSDMAIQGGEGVVVFGDVKRTQAGYGHV